jgi:Eco57I restriction-modification methylase
VEQDVTRIAAAFGTIADIPEMTPDEVKAKQAAYAELRRSADWEKAKWACDLWTAAFFVPLSTESASIAPTTRHVWDAIGGRVVQGKVADLVADLTLKQRFFHWPLEFPEVFATGGFNIMLGNPPWEVSQVSDKEFFAIHDPHISELPGAKRKRAIDALKKNNPILWRAYQYAKQAIDKQNGFVRNSGRFVLTAHGKLNTYALFSETFSGLLTENGRAGLIVPTGIAVEEGHAEFFETMSARGRLAKLYDFENTENLFRSVATLVRFSLLTLATNVKSADFIFCASNVEHLTDSRRRFTLSADEIALLNPNTKTAPAFRSQADAELAKSIYSRVPVLIQSASGEPGNPWGIRFRQGLFNMTSDSASFLTSSQLLQRGAAQHGAFWQSSKGERYLPLYEAKMMHVYDHRFGTYPPGQTADTRALPRLTISQYSDPGFEVNPRYYVSELEVREQLAGTWDRSWFLAFRGMSNHTNVRRFISGVLPYAGIGNSLTTVFADKVDDRRLFACLCANFSSMISDVIARSKISGTNVNFFYIEQLPILPPSVYGEDEINFVVKRVAELTYTSFAMKAFAEDIGYSDGPLAWQPDRRALLRSELDAFFAYLYGLTRRELEYILDPKRVMGEDYPSETFRVLKEREINEFGEYRTQRLVLEAWDRFAADGTFDPARLREPQYIDRVADELTATRRKLEETERNIKTLIALASATPKPTLFVEGATDAKILEAAWTVFFPSDQMPVKVIAAGGTKEMGSLAGKGKALREVLGDKVVLVLADNDSAGRALIDDGHIRRGGLWRPLPSGIHWCLLKPTGGFAAAMKTHAIPPAYWPFTIEAAFSPGLRRQALAAGAYKFSGDLQAELFENPDVARRLVSALPKLGPDDDVYWYLMAPHPEAKDAFAAWITDPERRTEENYAACEEIIRGLRTVLAGSDKSEGAIRTRGAA